MSVVMSVENLVIFRHIVRELFDRFTSLPAADIRLINQESMTPERRSSMFPTSASVLITANRPRLSSAIRTNSNIFAFSNDKKLVRGPFHDITPNLG